MRSLALGIALVCTLRAQVPATPVIQNTGRPMQVEYKCTADDVLWAGMSCSQEEPCPIYLELSAVEVVGNRIFLAGNIHSDSVTLYSILLSSEDAGRTWQEAFPRLRGSGLDHIQFVDFETGWVSGQLLFPLPQDPFLLLTGDGGKTWRNRPVFGEERAGSIQQFWFGSRQSGSLIIDRGQSGESSRYELYESPNGGETWLIRQTSDRPIALKGTRAAASGWRIRADAPSKSFSIERQLADRWNAIASFAVPIGFCKPPEPAPEPQPAPESDSPARPSPAPSLQRPRS